MDKDTLYHTQRDCPRIMDTAAEPFHESFDLRAIPHAAGRNTHVGVSNGPAAGYPNRREIAGAREALSGDLSRRQKP